MDMSVILPVMNEAENLRVLIPRLVALLDRERITRSSEADLPELSIRVLEALRTKERLTIAQLASITGANRNTLKVRLRELVADKRVQQRGKARATWYSL